jgi:hypothetical protein
LLSIALFPTIVRSGVATFFDSATFFGYSTTTTVALFYSLRVDFSRGVIFAYGFGSAFLTVLATAALITSAFGFST